LVQNPDLGWPEARHIRLDDRAPTHVGVEDLHHVTDCLRSGKKPSIGHEMGPFHPPSDGKHLCRGICRGIEIEMIHPFDMGIEGSKCNSKRPARQKKRT
jgi:hypothetical protein